MYNIFIINKKFIIENDFLVKVILLLEVTNFYFFREAKLFNLDIISTKIITPYVFILYKKLHLIRVFSKIIIYHILAIVYNENLNLFIEKSSII
jgi:hypothetical protein